MLNYSKTTPVTRFGIVRSIWLLQLKVRQYVEEGDEWGKVMCECGQKKRSKDGKTRSLRRFGTRTDPKISPTITFGRVKNNRRKRRTVIGPQHRQLYKNDVITEQKTLYNKELETHLFAQVIP